MADLGRAPPRTFPEGRGSDVFRSAPSTKGHARPFRPYRRRGVWVPAAFSVILATAWISVTTPATSASTSTVVSLNFDNNVANEYYLGFQDALQPAGVAATFYVNSGTIGTSNKLSWSELSSLAAAGDDIGGKTVDGTNLTTLTSQQQVSEICNDRQNIISHGITPITFAYPSGASTAAIQAEVQGCGYGNARTAGSLTPAGGTYAETLPPRSWLALRAYAPSGQVTLANLESLVSGAAAHGGGWIPIVIQRVCSATLDQANYSNCTASPGWIDLGDLQTFISWGQNAGQPGDAPAGTVFQTMGATAKAADTIAPTTTISCNGSPCQSSSYSGTVYVTLSPTDLGSGVASTHYTLDGTTPSLSSPTYTGPFPLTATATVQYRSWDNSGNVEAVHAQTVTLQEAVDTTPPVTTIACNGTSCQSGPYYQPETVSLSATDNPGGYGVADTYYTTDGSTPTTSSPVYTAPFTIHGPTTVKFFSTDLAGNAEQVNTQQINVETVVSLTFDDQYEDQWLYSVPLIAANNMTATYYVITSDSDNNYGCCMTWAQLDTLAAQGNDVGGQTIDHPDLTTLTEAQMSQELCGSRQDMINNGIPDPESMAYPFGDYNSTVESVAQQCGWNNARVGGGISDSNTTPTAPYVETIPPQNPYAIRTIAVDGASPENLSDLESFVTAASANGGGWLPITFHDVCDANASDYSDCMSKYGSIQDTIFGQFLSWLAAAGQSGGAPSGVVVKDVCQVMNCP
jgi:peptidoglycan/xylan/chitin deacetylase (PgdA/CDA1 family)